METPAKLVEAPPREAPAPVSPLARKLSSVLSARRLLAFVLGCAVFMLAAGPVTDPDFWWHLRTGQLICETRAVPHVDPYSFTARGAEWVAHEWLSEVLMYGLYRSAGWGGLVVFFSLLTAAPLLLAFRGAVVRGAHAHVAAAATLLAALAAAPITGVRPQMLSFLFTGVFVFVIDRHAREGRGRALWWLPALMLVWVNAHGGFALGLALLAVAAAGLLLDELLGWRDADGDPPPRRPLWGRLRSSWPRARPLCLALAACAAVVPLNPNGARLFSYPVETIMSQAMQKYIVEWLSPNFHQPHAHAFALLLFATFAALALSPKRVRPGELLLVCVAAYAALRAWRNIPFFTLVAVPALAEHAWAFVESRRGASGAGWAAPSQSFAKLSLNVALLVCVPAGLCALKVVGVTGRQESVEAAEFPAAAAGFLRGRADVGPLYNAYGWGGYLIWKLHPERPVYIDGRADVYGDALVEECLKIEAGEPGWRAALEARGVRAVLTKPDVPLASLLREDGGWVRVYEDGQAVLFFKH